MSDASELRQLAQRLGNPLADSDATSPATDVVVTRNADRATADDRLSPRASLDRKLRAAKAAENDLPEP